jgi:hypothetical protein
MPPLAPRPMSRRDKTIALVATVLVLTVAALFLYSTIHKSSNARALCAEAQTAVARGLATEDYERAAHGIADIVRYCES